MKRLITATVAVAALAIPASAGAGFSASADSAASAKGAPMAVNFTAIKQGGKPIGVDDFRVRRLPMTCTEGDARLKFNLKLPGNSYFPVNNRGKFRAIGSDANSSVKVTGKFQTNNKVKGRVSAEGDFPDDGLSNCTGQQGYTAG